MAAPNVEVGSMPAGPVAPCEYILSIDISADEILMSQTEIAAVMVITNTLTLSLQYAQIECTTEDLMMRSS